MLDELTRVRQWKHRIVADPRVIIARREISSLRHEKTIVLALLIQLFIAVFASFLVVGLVSLYDPASVSGNQIVVGVSGETTESLTAVIAEDDSVGLIRYSTSENALNALESGEVDAALLTNRSEAGSVNVTAHVPQQSLVTTTVVVQLRSILQEYETRERQLRDSHIQRDVVPVPSDVESNPYFGFTYTVLFPLLMLLPIFISGSIAVDTIIEEREEGTLELLQVTPTSLRAIIDGKLLAAVGIVPVQAALWIGLLTANGIQINHIFALLVLVTALALIIGVVGIVVALHSADRQQAQFLFSSGILSVVGLTTLLPQSPMNTVTRLAAGSAGWVSMLFVGGYCVVAIVLYQAAHEFQRYSKQN